MKISAKAAIKLWTASRRSNLIRLSRTLSRGGTVEDIARDLALELFRRHYRGALSWLVSAILEAGHAIDEALTWERIRNERLREWFEDRDDVGAGIIRAINALASVIEEDCKSLQGRDPDDVAADLCVDLLGGGGRTPGFFRNRAPRLRTIGVVSGADYPGLPGYGEDASEEPLEAETREPAGESVEAPESLSEDTLEADPETEETPSPEAASEIASFLQAEGVSPGPELDSPPDLLGLPPADRLRSALSRDEAERTNTDRSSDPDSPTASRRRTRRRVQR